MSEHDRSRYPQPSVLVLAAVIGAFLVVQTVVLLETAGRETDHLVRTAWFVVLAVGIPLGVVSAVLR